MPGEPPRPRARAPAVSRSWMAMHPITEASPLHGADPEMLQQWELELNVSLVGIDDTSLQSIHAQHSYDAADIVWGVRHADVLSELPDGALLLDMTKFHDVVATEATATFPYSDGRRVGG